MNNRVQKIANLRTVQALRGQSLTIDLGKPYTGTLTAWMKRNPNDSNYRSFDIVDNRFLFLSKEKAQDYSSTDIVEGKWYFDVRHLPQGKTLENDERMIYTGSINFSNHITDSNGTEIAQTPAGDTAMVDNSKTTYGVDGQVLSAKELIMDVAEVKTIKAIRAQALTIDLGRSYNGYKLQAWMKKNHDDNTYRSFNIVDNRFLFLPKDKTQDYYDIDTNKKIESIAGKWYFDVRAIPSSATNANDEHLIVKGIINFTNNVTDSLGQELVYADRPYANEFINLNDTPIEYLPSDAGKVVMVNDNADGLKFQEIIQDLHFTFEQNLPSDFWTIVHNLDKYPAVEAVDSAKSVVFGSIDYLDKNSLTITFNAPFSGSAYLN